MELFYSHLVWIFKCFSITLKTTVNQQYLLSIDQGTTGTTVFLMDTGGRVKGRASREFKQRFPKPGWVEHNPVDIWQSVLSTVKKVMLQTGVKARQITAIGITNQRETVMAWDRETGEPVGPAIVWQCRRTSSFCKLLSRKNYQKKVNQITGLVLDPYFSGTKMRWILKNNSEAGRLAGKSRLCFGTVDSFLVWKLTGGKNFVTDVSNASRTLLMDLKTLDYDNEMLKLFGLKREMLPAIQPSSGVFGKTQRIAGLMAGTPITGVIGDQQSALFGQLCFGLGESKITFGTGSFLLMNTKNRKVATSNGLLTTIAWQLEGDKKATYALEGGAFICGAAVQWLRDQLGLISSSSKIEKLAEKASDTGGLEFVPSFSGLGTPFWNPSVRGTLFGITRGSEPKHIARATLEALALQNLDIVRAMLKEARISPGKVRVDGGAASNNLLMQIQADFLGVDVIRPKMIETTALGSGFMAGLGAGVWSSPDELKKLDSVDRIFKPRMRLNERKKRLKKWHKAIESMQIYYD